MDAYALRDFLLTLPHVTEDQPFGPEVVVFRVGGKIFALLSPYDVPASINLKCDPERAVALREAFEAVRPGYHMNKTHWNTVTLGLDASRDDLVHWVQHSYALVFKSLTAKVRATLSA